MFLTEALAKYTTDLDINKLDPEIVRQANLFFADGLACIAAGAREKPVLIATEYAKKFGGAKSASVLCSDVKTDVCSAALANGIAAHIHDFDDVSDSSNAHVSVVMIPTVLALGEELKANGKDILEAYIAGVEVCALAGRAMGKENFRRGWHSTSSLGIFGAVAAAGRLMKLDLKQLTYAMGIAASESSGIKANFGTMAKSFHAGSAASKAIRIVRLASVGYDSNPACIEEKCGFADLTIGGADMTPAFDAIEKGISEFIDPGMVMKPYPSCKASHNGIDAMYALVTENDLHPDDIKKVDVRVQLYAMDLLRFPVAKTKLEGKFSLNYCMAQIIKKRELILSDFDGISVDDPTIIELMKKMTVEGSETLNEGENMLVRGDTEVRVLTNDGRDLIKRVNYATGDPHCPLTEERRLKKLRDCFGRTLNPNGVQAVIETLGRLERLADISELTSLMNSSAL
ncbi:MAG: MmgE/PrpD family protein [Oscillospiraceae bacterium]|nr:MmgE/PrpD family protein [Oscillospiraceae bacterium]